MEPSKDWYEIKDPQTGKVFFANLETGACSWLAPDDAAIRMPDADGEWWEFFDESYKLPYFYNTKSQQTVWKRPRDGLIIIQLTAIQNSDFARKRMSDIGPPVRSSSDDSLSSKSSTATTTPVRSSMHSLRVADVASFQLPPLNLSSTPTITPTSPHPNSTNLVVESPRSLSNSKSQFLASATNSATSQQPVSPTVSSLSAVPVTNILGSQGDLTLISARKNIDAAKTARTQGISGPQSNIDAVSILNPFRKSSNQNSASVPKLNTGVSPPPPTGGLARIRTGIHRSFPEFSSKPSPLSPELSAQIRQFSIDGFANRYFSEHRKGLFRRRVPMEKMLRHSRNSLAAPLMVLNKDLHKDALKCFKLLQRIMTEKTTPLIIRDIQTLLERGITRGELRDEIFVQLCKQLTGNPAIESTRKGWQLMGVFTLAFPPSKNFEEYLKEFIQSHLESQDDEIKVLAKYSYKKLLAVTKKGPRGKAPSVSEIERALIAAFNPSVFGETLDEIMKMQASTHPTKKIPPILEFLSEAVVQLNGLQSEGLFRVPGDSDAVLDLKCRIEKNQYTLGDIQDPNVPSSLLKLWMRELADPLIPTVLYDECIAVGKMEEPDAGNTAIEIIGKLPEINRRVATFMINFLRRVGEPANHIHTKMTLGNLAMVFAPNFLRCPSDNPATIFENTKYEQAFLRRLLDNNDRLLVDY